MEVIREIPHMQDGSIHEFIDAFLYQTRAKPAKHDLSTGTNLCAFFPSIKRRLLRGVNSDSLIQYDSPLGNTKLRKSIAAYENALSQLNIDMDSVIVTHGCTEAIYLLMQALRSIGKRRVLFIGPQFPTLFRCAQSAGLKTFQSTEEVNDIDLLIRTARADIVVQSLPGNPNGLISPSWWLSKLLASARNHNAEVIIDKVCSDIPTKYWNCAYTLNLLCSENALDSRVHIVDSFSKRRALPGLRVGYLLTCSKSVRSAVSKSIVGRSTPTFATNALCWDLDVCTQWLNKNVRFLRNEEERKHILAVEAYQKIVKENINIASSILGDYLRSPIMHDSGINAIVETINPIQISDRRMVRILAEEHGIWTYPVSCFEGISGLEPRRTFRNRVTFALPQSELISGFKALKNCLSAGFKSISGISN